MPRGRSKSIVQKIANDVNDTDTHLNLDNETHQATTFKHTRTKSESSPIRNKTRVFDNLYPFTKEESQLIWHNFTQRYNHDMILSMEDIKIVNEYQLDSVLNLQNCLDRNNQELNNFITQTQEVIHDMEEVLLNYNRISKDTVEFDQKASQLLNEQNETNEKYTKIYEYLKHFENLEIITKHLSRSGNHLLNQKREFFKHDILNEIDQSLMFLNDHPKFKECELYKSRFRQCMTRALTLIRNFLNNELKSISDTIERKLSEGEKISILVYNEFNTYLQYHSDSFTDLFIEISKRVENHKEYVGLLHDVTNTYFQIRLKLISLYINNTSTINNIYTLQDLKIVQTCQDQISYFKNIADREYQLYLKYFGSNDVLNDSLYQFLKNAIDPLYDGIRLLILKEHNITNLCQLTTLLSRYYEFEDDETGSLPDVNTESVKYGILFQSILDDAQNRLIFRIQNYVDTKLIPYKPKPADLKIGHRKEQESNVLDLEYRDNLFPDLYLPLGKALTLLSNIYELINSVVFDDLAHYIVHACIELLKGEFYKLAIGHLGAIEGKLLYINNLIILKNQINHFDIQFTRTDYSIDFTSGLSDIWQMIKSRNFNYDNGFVELAKKTVPKIINNMMDANHEIELELNNSVGDFINHCSNTICEPILSVESSRTVMEKSSKLKDNLIMEIPNYYHHIKTILDDETVTKFLMNNLANLIMITYENFYVSVSSDIKALDDLMNVAALDGFVNDLVNSLIDEEDSLHLDKLKINDTHLHDLKSNDTALSSGS